MGILDTVLPGFRVAAPMMLSDEGFRADIVVENAVILELKSVETVSNTHKKQVLTYLRLTNKKLGFLLNFGEDVMKDGIYRIINGDL